MIIRHSLKLLEQLTEIEGLIQKIEHAMLEKGVECDREKILMTLMYGQKREPTSGTKK